MSKELQINNGKDVIEESKKRFVLPYLLFWIVSIFLCLIFSVLSQKFVPLTFNDRVTNYLIIFIWFIQVGIWGILFGHSSSSFLSWVIKMMGHGIASFCILYFLVPSVVIVINGSCDFSQPNTHIVTVTSFGYLSENTVTFELWNRKESVTFQLSPSDYMKVMNGYREMKIVTKSGALGIEWIVEKGIVTDEVSPASL